MKNLPIVTLIPRVGWLLAIFFVTNWACMTQLRFRVIGRWDWNETVGGYWRDQTPVEWAGPLLWLLPFGIGIYLMVILVLHLFFRETIDKDINSGAFVVYWQSAPSELKLKLIFAAVIGFFLSLSIAYAGLVRVGG